ncbi:MAG: hypothetical protein QN173_10920 [Armatimonadota bacterium]|nr:hypothetical protein [Armatimonadota bacterium]MDR7402357.1 hypothetical protein [Armatimonadota bacterium]MDR7404966.1 hypothetical protein [Armatimonadota bacterium]MDR7437342.1 hypothetical protein [Armatimonadota bacterium]MDR7472681.1 hypothetical protein [Armatimonadota bacterium]
MAVVGLAVAASAAGAGGTDPAPTFAEVVRRLEAVNPTLRTLIVEQDADVRVLGIFRFILRTTVYAARPAVYRVVVHEAPAALRSLGNTFQLVSSPQQVLADYRASGVRWADQQTLEVELEALRPAVNPPSVTALIDARRWLVLEATLRYAWGPLQVRYHYAEIEGYLLPDAARASIPTLFPVTASLSYRNYRLNVPLPPDIVSGPPSTAP